MTHLIYAIIVPISDQIHDLNQRHIDVMAIKRYIHEGKSILSYHGDFNRDNHFWVYPSYKPLHNPAWDTYDASELCNNYTNLGTSS
ncbi:unnamed protein product [Rotaria magnacalcarata]